MKRYPAYRDSGVEWLGEVPEGWGVGKFRHQFRESSEKIEAEVVGPMLSVSRYRGIEVKEYDDENRRRLEEDLIGYRIVRPGQLVVNTVWLNYAGLGVSDFEGHVSPAYRSHEFRDAVERRFHHLLRSSIYVQGYTKLLTGIRPNSLQMSRDDLMDFPIILPPLTEQTAIAAFLDVETAKIDGLVTEQRRLIDLLREKRQAVISHAVTKGLNPTAPLKPSGIDWLGDVPEGWEVCGIKYFCKRITDGAHISPDTENGAFPFVSTKDVNDAGIDFENCLQTSAATYQYMKSTGCQPERGDVLFSKDGTIGRTVIVATDMDFVVASSLIVIRPDHNHLSAEFLNYLCQSPVVANQVASFVKGAGLPRLSITNLLKVLGVFPPRGEQVSIAKHLDAVTAQFDSLTATAESAIALLQERRAALISAAVTGKIDVRPLLEKGSQAA